MAIVLDIVVVLVCILGLWGGAVWIVDGAGRVAKRLGVSELMIGLTVVALGTSAPEFAVTVVAALNGHADISVGNIVGSNMFNLGFILGGVALVRVVAVPRKLVYRDGVALIAAALLLLFLMRDLRLERWEGGCMLLALCGYLGVLFHGRERLDDPPAGDMQQWDIARLLGGLVLVLAGGHFLVGSACRIAAAAGLSEWTIGVTVVAAGTSTPEMATALVGVLRGRCGISVGSLIGSDLFNMLGVLGLAAVLNPMSIGDAGFGSLVIMLCFVIAVIVLMRTGWRLTRLEGAVLVLLNLIRWIVDFY